MEQVLRNIANRLLLEFCIKNNIDRGTQGTYTVKDGRGFSYKLVDQTTGQRTFARVTFHKSQVPTFQF